MRSKNHKHSSKVAASENLASAAAQHNITVSSMLEDSQNKKQHANSSSKTGKYGCESSNIVSYLNQQRNSSTTTSSTSITSSICSSIGGMQLTLGAGFGVTDPSVESQLTMAISDLIHSRGLAFSIASDPKF